jgi:hypothetical protein
MITINHIGLAAYIQVVKDIPYSEIPVKDADNKFIFTFDITKEEIDVLKKEFLNSPFRKYDNEIRELKRVLNS